MLSVGTSAPEIDALSTNGTRFVLSEAQASSLCTIVYFFPRSFTPGCIEEAHYFKQAYPELALAGATLVGVSADSLETQCEFAKSVGATFPIVPDPDKKLCEAYDVLLPIVGVSMRITYVIVEGKIAAAYRHHWSIEKHRDDVLKFVDELYNKKKTARESMRPPRA